MGGGGGLLIGLLIWVSGGGGSRLLKRALGMALVNCYLLKEGYESHVNLAYIFRHWNLPVSFLQVQRTDVFRSSDVIQQEWVGISLVSASTVSKYDFSSLNSSR